MYVFFCKKCELEFEHLCKYEERDAVKCPECNKKKSVEKRLGACNITFSNPKGTSKMDNFSYAAGYNLEKAQGERRAAEAEAKVRGIKNPYNRIDDISSGVNFGEVK